MSDIRRNADRNRAIQAMITDGEELKAFYRFVVNNPHIALHDACQIVIARPSASVCFSFEEWNALGRRVTKGRKGIPYYDSDGNKYFVFDVTDTHGENRYRRATQPVKKILDACGQTAEPLRGKGIGGRLIVQMANALAAEGEHPVFLCAPERVHFYTRLGFAKLGEYVRFATP